MRLILIFAIVLVITLVIIRMGAAYLHDYNAYQNGKWKGAKYDHSKTLTGFLRQKINIDIHHFHIGLMILLIIIPIIFLIGLNKITTSILAIGTCMFLDQLLDILFNIEYFSINSILISLIMNIIAVITFYYITK